MRLPSSTSLRKTFNHLSRLIGQRTANPGSSGSMPTLAFASTYSPGVWMIYGLMPSQHRQCPLSNRCQAARSLLNQITPYAGYMVGALPIGCEKTLVAGQSKLSLPSPVSLFRRATWIFPHTQRLAFGLWSAGIILMPGATAVGAHSLPDKRTP